MLDILRVETDSRTTDCNTAIQHPKPGEQAYTGYNFMHIRLEVYNLLSWFHGIEYRNRKDPLNPNTPFMKRKKCMTWLLAFAGLMSGLTTGLTSQYTQAQPASLVLSDATPSPTNEALFAPLNLPPPNTMRTAQGAPGPDYWQQRADYFIRASLDPASHRVQGTVKISYTNNSPYPLEALWIQLDQNAFSPSSRSAALQGASSRWRGAFEDGGYLLSNVSVNRLGQHSVPAYTIEDTRLHVPLENPLPPGGSLVDISMDFTFTIPEYGADRMGRLEVQDGTVYQMAQWFPRMYVFDDVNGWNAMPYLGQGEFYLEYGNIRAELSVPSDFIVVATGTLINPEEVYTRDQVKRLEKARSSNEVVTIIGENEVGRRKTRPTDTDTLTWIFEADNVRDFAWATSQAFLLDAAQSDGVMVMSAYPREGLGGDGNPGWESSTEFLLHSLPLYSAMWAPYPYPTVINVAGTVGGMEYPMVLFCGVERRGEALFGVTDHELGHMWFPMMVGSDERRHAWMDEGFTTFLNYYAQLSYYGESASRLQRYAPDTIAGRMSESLASQPIMTYPDRLRPGSIGFLAYRKPAAGLLLLREYILGPERFDRAFRSYIDRWAFKHPQPADFFRTIEQGAGEDLAWFWRGWFYGTTPFDPSIELMNPGTTRPALVVRHNTDLLLPLEVRIHYAGGAMEEVRIPIESFYLRDFVVIGSADGSIERVTVDPNLRLPDVDRSNNSWGL